MKAMFSKKGLLTIGFTILLIFAIYYVFNPKEKTYIAIGDFYALGRDNYGYKDYLKDRLKNENRLKYYNDTYVKKGYTIKQLKKDIKNNDFILYNGTTISIKKELREADILTITIGLEDILNNLSIKEVKELEEVDEKEFNRVVEKTKAEYETLIKELKKYTKNKIIIVPYTFPKNKYYPKTYERIRNWNQELLSIINKEKLSTINFFVTNSDNYFYPTYQIYKRQAYKIYEIL